jgi:hypothetical protein
MKPEHEPQQRTEFRRRRLTPYEHLCYLVRELEAKVRSPHEACSLLFESERRQGGWYVIYDELLRKFWNRYVSSECSESSDAVLGTLVSLLRSLRSYRELLARRVLSDTPSSSSHKSPASRISTLRDVEDAVLAMRSSEVLRSQFSVAVAAVEETNPLECVLEMLAEQSALSIDSSEMREYVVNRLLRREPLPRCVSRSIQAAAEASDPVAVALQLNWVSTESDVTLRELTLSCIMSAALRTFIAGARRSTHEDVDRLGACLLLAAAALRSLSTRITTWDGLDVQGETITRLAEFIHSSPSQQDALTRRLRHLLRAVFNALPRFQSKEVTDADDVRQIVASLSIGVVHEDSHVGEKGFRLRDERLSKCICYHFGPVEPLLTISEEIDDSEATPDFAGDDDL